MGGWCFFFCRLRRFFFGSFSQEISGRKEGLLGNGDINFVCRNLRGCTMVDLLEMIFNGSPETNKRTVFVRRMFKFEINVTKIIIMVVNRINICGEKLMIYFLRS